MQTFDYIYSCSDVYGVQVECIRAFGLDQRAIVRNETRNELVSAPYGVTELGRSGSQAPNHQKVQVIKLSNSILFPRKPSFHTN